MAKIQEIALKVVRPTQLTCGLIEVLDKAKKMTVAAGLLGVNGLPKGNQVFVRESDWWRPDRRAHRRPAWWLKLNRLVPNDPSRCLAPGLSPGRNCRPTGIFRRL